MPIQVHRRFEKYIVRGFKYAHWIGLYVSFHLNWVLDPFVHGKLENLQTSEVTFARVITPLQSLYTQMKTFTDHAFGGRLYESPQLGHWVELADWTPLICCLWSCDTNIQSYTGKWDSEIAQWLHTVELYSEGPATRWRIRDKLIANRGKIAICIPSHMMAITIRELLG